MANLIHDPVAMATDAFKKEIRVCRASIEASQSDIAKVLGVGHSRMSVLMSNPDEFTVGRLRKMIRMLKPDPLTVLGLLGYTQTEIRQLQKKWRDSA